MCLAILASPTTFAGNDDSQNSDNSEGWLGRLGDFTDSLIPDFKIAKYLEPAAPAPFVGVGMPISQQDEFRLQLNETPEAAGYAFGKRYIVNLVDADMGGTCNTAGVVMLSRDATAGSPVRGLARTALNTDPTPLYGLDFAVSMSPRWSLDVRGRILDAATSDVDTSLSSYSASFAYAARRDVSVGFGYEQFEMQSDAELQAMPGYVSYKYSGPRFFTTLRF